MDFQAHFNPLFHAVAKTFTNKLKAVYGLFLGIYYK